MSIPFTQYLRPNGRKKPVEIDRSAEIERLANVFITSGGRFECEELNTGVVSLTAFHPKGGEDGDGDDIAIELVRNGPEVPAAVDKLVITTQRWLQRAGIVALAVMIAVPVLRSTGSCPHGYGTSGAYCVPRDGAQYAIPKPRTGSCPHGWLASGDFCVR